MSEYRIAKNDELMHYGVKGMRWHKHKRSLGRELDNQRMAVKLRNEYRNKNARREDQRMAAEEGKRKHAQYEANQRSEAARRSPGATIKREFNAFKFRHLDTPIINARDSISRGISAAKRIASKTIRKVNLSAQKFILKLLQK